MAINTEVKPADAKTNGKVDPAAKSEVSAKTENEATNGEVKPVGSDKARLSDWLTDAKDLLVDLDTLLTDLKGDDTSNQVILRFATSLNKSAQKFKKEVDDTLEVLSI